jgi:Mg2+-importing ATPase
MNFSQYTTRTSEEIFSLFKTSEGGIFEKEAEERLKKYGLNQVKTRETTLFDIFLRQIKSPFVYLLIIATIIAFVIGEKIDGLVIAGFILINVILGFTQEARAERAILLLKKYLPSKTRVLRDGSEKTIDKTLLVPGDIVLLENGNIAPADLFVVKTEDLLVDESVLTGESAAVSKSSEPLEKETKEIFEAKNIVFAGTSVISGELKGLVINTGKDTVLGEVTKLVSTIKRESIYEKNLLKFSRLILKIVIVTIIVVFLANLVVKGTTNILNFSLFCIAMIVGIIPEALPLIAVFSLSSGALKLAKEKVVVRRLSAVEDLGNIEILCSDKTGTLTEGKMVLDKVFSINKEKCMQYALLSSAYIAEKIESSLTPFDSAILTQMDGHTHSFFDKFKSIEEIPFSSERMRNSVLIKAGKEKNILIVKGAPEKILKLSSRFEDSLTIKKLKEQIEKEGSTGKRILAIGYKEFDKESYTENDESGLIFLGYFSFSDPLKPTAKKSIQIAEELGVDVKIVTGDSKEVSAYIAKQIGLIKNSSEVILGEELDLLSGDEFLKACEEYSVFARISPQTKHRIVEALSKKHEVGFLGEGINDAPALKAAHVAIAVESAADVSREVADIVLMEKDLNVIINGIRNGRNIFSNINKYIKTTLASNFGNFISIAIISLMIPFLPMLPIQILLINLLSDFPLIAVASDSVDAEELKKPKYYQLSRVIGLIVFLGLVSTLFDFLFFGIFHKIGESKLQTLWYIESILTEIILIFSIRTSRFFLKSKMPNPVFLFISISTILVTVFLPFTDFGRSIFHFVIPDQKSLFIVFSLILGYFIISEAAKLYYFRHWMHRKK